MKPFSHWRCSALKGAESGIIGVLTINYFLTRPSGAVFVLSDSVMIRYI
jgi:hypothetical protein